MYSRLEPTNRDDFKGRFDWNISNSTKAYVRIANEGETAESPRGVWWAPADVVALPTPNIGENRGRSYAGNIVTVLSPSMTNEVLVSYSRLTLDNRYKDPSCFVRAPAESPSTAFSPPAQRARTCRRTCCTAGAAAVRLAISGRRPTTCYAHNDALQFSNKLTKLAGAHGLKFGISIERGQKQQNFQNLEAGQLWFGSGQHHGHGQLRRRHAGGPHRTVDQGTARNGNPARPAMPYGKWRYWNIDAFAQDSWKLRSNLTFEYGVRLGKWTNNKEICSASAATSPPSSMTRPRDRSSIRGRSSA